MRPVVAGFFLSLVPLFTAVEAQAPGEAPAAGTWGAEGVVAGGGGGASSLLRFRNDRSAWVFGFGLESMREEFNGATTRFTSVGLRAGLRRYQPAGRAIRPFNTMGVGVDRLSGSADLWQAGVFGDMGAAYFFSRHASVGASGDARVLFGRRSGPPTATSTRVSISGPRILGTVYF